MANNGTSAPSNGTDINNALTTFVVGTNDTMGTNTAQEFEETLYLDLRPPYDQEGGYQLRTADVQKAFGSANKEIARKITQEAFTNYMPICSQTSVRQRETVAAPIVPNPTNNALPATGLGGAGATMMDAATGATKGVHVQDLGQAASAVVSTQGEVNPSSSVVCNKEGLDAPDRSSGRSEVTCKARNGQAAAKSKTADAAHHNDTLFPTSSRSEAAVSMSPAPSLTTKVKDDAGHNLDGSDFEKAVFVEILGKKAEWSRKEDTTAIFLVQGVRKAIRRDGQKTRIREREFVQTLLEYGLASKATRDVFAKKELPESYEDIVNDKRHRREALSELTRREYEHFVAKYMSTEN